MADAHSASAHSHSTPLAPPNSKVWIRPWWCHSFPFSEPFALAISFGLHRGSLLGAGVILTMRQHRHVYLSTRVHWPTLRENMRENIRPLSSSCPPVSRELALCRCLLYFFGFIAMSTAENVSHLLNLRGTDGSALSEVIDDYFGGRTGRGRPRYVYIL